MVGWNVIGRIQIKTEVCRLSLRAFIYLWLAIMKNGLKEKEEMHVFTLLSFYKAKDTFSEMYLENSTHALEVFQFRKNAK